MCDSAKHSDAHYKFQHAIRGHNSRQGCPSKGHPELKVRVTGRFGAKVSGGVQITSCIWSILGLFAPFVPFRGPLATFLMWGESRNVYYSYVGSMYGLFQKSHKVRGGGEMPVIRNFNSGCPNHER